MAPIHSGYANVNGARFHYQIYGDLNSRQPPLLVLHGSYMSADSMAPLSEPFADTRPVIALDARGHGRTGDLPGPITYEQTADDSTGVLEALKVRKAGVLGYSMGGGAGLHDRGAACASRNSARYGTRRHQANADLIAALAVPFLTIPSRQRRRVSSKNETTSSSIQQGPFPDRNCHQRNSSSLLEIHLRRIETVIPPLVEAM